MNEMSIQELVESAKRGCDKARRVAWARVIEGREVLQSGKFRTMRLVAGPELLNTLRRNVEWATEELNALTKPAKCGKCVVASH